MDDPGPLLKAADASLDTKPLDLDAKDKGESVLPSVPVEPDYDVATNPWPDKLGEDAYYGLTGEVVRAIEPETEADPVAILSQFLVGFGNMIGRNCYYRVESTRHYPNLFIVLVGQSSRARKGTSWHRALRVLERCGDEQWSLHRVLSGLSSGEGLIWEVRDPTIRVTADEEKETDPGVEDKRLLIVEEEFQSVLAVGKREGNILGGVLRSAWDTGKLGTLTKHSPARCAAGHISIISHITRDELVASVHSTQAHNGFLNRFLWFAVQRSRLLPFGGKDNVTFAMADRLELAWKFAVLCEREVVMSEPTKELWRDQYPVLTADRKGLFGAITSRSEAQVIRLALVYALLDKSIVIELPHLKAALAIEKYVEQSAKHVFGDLSGNPLVDEIGAFFRANEKGVNQTQISDYFSRNYKRDVIQAALSELLSTGKATCEKIKTGKAGRPLTIWKWRL